jgi:hypothetical protein
MPAPFRAAARYALAVLCLAVASAACANKTVCTITVNSADEKNAFRRALGPGYDFVELVEHGRHDWLESACRSKVRCDVLVISGHYDGGNEFFSDRTEAREYLPVDELERASCSNTCGGVFSQLKEVYLFGCNTLNPGANAVPTAEIGRSLMRAGMSRAEADRFTRTLAAAHGESSRDRMRLVFRNVPAIYGFSSVAPLGPVAASILRHHFEANGTSEVGSGRVSQRLLGQFSAHSLAVTSGLSDNEPLAAHRRDVCEFADDQRSPERRIDFLHSLFERQMAEVRMFLPRLERFAAKLPPPAERSSATSDALDAIARDDKARDRYLEFARDADSSAIRARMIALAGRLGWLTPAGERDEIVRMFNDRLAANAVTPAEVDLACELNKDGDLDADAPRVRAPAQREGIAQSALLACLGDGDARERVLRALTSPSEDEVRFAQVYLRHRPLDDAQELRTLTADIARMPSAQAQVQALHALAQHRLTDRDSMTTLLHLYPVAETAGVQAAIAGILLRSDYRSIASPEVVQTLRTRRLRGGIGDDAIDVLIRRMQARTD